MDELYDDLQTFKVNWPEYEWVYHHYMSARQNTLPNNFLYEKSPDWDPNKPAYQESWHEAFKEYGRMPRVEAFYNKQPQRWCDITELGYQAKLEEDFWS
jgi:hypothetical protein